MNPRNPASTRLVTELEGRGSVADWSPDDRELLVVNAPAENRNVTVARERQDRRKDALHAQRENWRCGARPVYSPDGRYVYVLSNRGSEVLRLWRGEVATAKWKR